MKDYDENKTISRYYNPPLEVREFGRRLLKSENFDELLIQIKENEVILGLYQMYSDNYTKYDVATHIHNQDRLNKVWNIFDEEFGKNAPIEFFAISKTDANQKLDVKIP